MVLETQYICLNCSLLVGVFHMTVVFNIFVIMFFMYQVAVSQFRWLMRMFLPMAGFSWAVGPLLAIC